MGDLYPSEGDSSALADLEQRQEAILKRLQDLMSELAKTENQLDNQLTGTDATLQIQPSWVQPGRPHDVVISADPSHPPLSVLVLRDLLARQCKVLTVTHTHSSSPPVPTKLNQAFNTRCNVLDRTRFDLVITVIWKKVDYGPVLMVKPNQQTPIQGEENVARYLARLLHPAYDDAPPTVSMAIDGFVDLFQPVVRGDGKERAAALRLMDGRKSRFIVGQHPCLADIVLWSAVHQASLTSNLPNNVSKWLNLCDDHPWFKSFASSV